MKKHCLYITSALLILAPAVAAAQAAPRDCFRGRPLPTCHSFWITEFGWLWRLTPLPEPRVRTDPFFRWEVGGMNNYDARTALGATILLEADDLGSRIGLKPRYRRWLGEAVALDLSAGVLVNGSNGFRFPGFVAQVAVTADDQLGAVAQVETFRTAGRTDVGAYAGVKLGGVAGIVVGLILPALYVAGNLSGT